MTGAPEDTTDSMLADLLRRAPVGVVVLDGDRRIEIFNDAAKTLLDCKPGTAFPEYVHATSADALARVFADPPAPRELQIVMPDGGKATVVEARSTPVDDQRSALFLLDVAEKIALERQLRSLREPSRRLMHELHTANTTMLGYAELIAVMLEEEPVMTNERLVVVRRYHTEMRKALENVNRLLKREREGGMRPDATAIPLNRKHVVVVDDERAISEFLAELMRGLQHKVSVFSNARDAVEFCERNLNSIDLVITDDRMPDVTGPQLADSVHAIRSEVPVVMCSEEPRELELRDGTYACPKPIDINELSRLVNELI